MKKTMARWTLEIIWIAVLITLYLSMPAKALLADGEHFIDDVLMCPVGGWDCGGAVAFQ